MDAPLGKAVRGALSGMEAGTIERASFEVRLNGEAETVWLRMRDGQLRTSCSCCEPECAHVRTVLRLAAGEPEPTSGVVPAPPVLPPLKIVTTSLAPSPPRRSLPPARRPTPRPSNPRALDRHALAEVLDEVITAIVRAGLGAPSGVSVQDPLERVTRLLPNPPPLGLCRFVGRLRHALETRDESTCARLLDAAGHWVDDARSDDANATGDAGARITALLDGSDAPPQTLTDRTWLELAREHVAGLERVQIERRYLIDLESGELLREQCLRRSQAISIGPCPRVLDVGFAEVDAHGAPRNARLLQYSVSVDVPADSWRSVQRHAAVDFAALAQSYREGLERHSGLQEPFALIAPAALARDAQLVLLDAATRRLTLVADDDLGVLRRIDELTAGVTPAWVAGRLLDRQGQLLLRPLALGILRGEELRHERL
jgi:hypothetical protein